MLIVHVVRQFVPSVGGLEDVVRELSARQVEHGFAVRVVTLDRIFLAKEGASGARLPSYESVNGVEVVRIPYWGSRRYPIAPRVLRYIRHADIVHVHGIDFFFDFLALTKAIHRRTLVASTHGGFFHTPYASWLKSIWFRIITSMSMRAYAGIVAVSNSDFDRFVSVRPTGLHCIENGVNIGKLASGGSPSPKKAMICIGRLSTNKRLDRLIAFLKEVRDIDPDWTLAIAGRAWDQGADEIREMAAAFGQQNALTVMESPTDQDIRDEMGRSSIFVSASEYEGFGLAAVEGMSAGLYPVLSDIEAFRSLAGATGVGKLLSFNDPTSAARSFVGEWKTIHERYGILRAASMKASQAYEWSSVSSCYLTLYRSVLGASTRTILDVPVQLTNRRGAALQLERLLERKSRRIIAFGNANLLNCARRDKNVREALRQFLVLNDGVGTDIASRVLYGAKFPENLNGTDFVPYLLSQLPRSLRIFLLGAKPGIAERAASMLERRFPRHRVVGTRDGFGDIDAPELIEAIRSSNADVLLVGLGNPRQELWLARHFAVTDCTLGIAVGALFDFMAGDVSRAPVWVRSARLEWLYRFCLEPRRLASRYLLGNPRFLSSVVALWWSGARGEAHQGSFGTNMTGRT